MHRTGRNMLMRTAGLVAVAALLAIAPPADAFVDLGEPAPWLTTSGSSCVTPCRFFQDSDGGVNTYVAPSAGVITQFTMTTGSSFTGVNGVALDIYRPQSGGNWLLAAESEHYTELGPLAGVRQIVPTRVSVQPGDHLGISVEFDGDTAWQWPTGAKSDVVQQVSTLGPTVGTTIPSGDLTPTSFARLNLTARLEGDADGDGYGDGSQDACPLDPARQATPCTPPAVTGMTLLPRAFRVDKGGKIMKNAAAGASIRFKLTQPADVQFVVSRVNSGRRKGRNCVKPNRANRTHKRCHYFTPGHNFELKSLPAGAQKIAYSGRYKHGRGARVLKPGRYLLTAVPANTGGVGVVAKARFRIVK